MKVAVILVNYNAQDDTVECISSLLISNYDNIKIYVIDNASEDISKIDQLVDQNKVHLFKMDKNCGFGAASNFGAERAVEEGAGALMFLNNDTVVDPTLVKRMVQRIRNDTIVVPKMLYFESDKIWYGGGEVSLWTGKFKHMKYESEKRVSFVTGCCFMMTAECYRKLGLFPTEYFLYYEDSDFSIKANIHTIKLLYVPNAVLWHKVSTSTSKLSNLKSYYLNRNRLYILRKYKAYFHITAIIYYVTTRAIPFVLGLIGLPKFRPIYWAIHDALLGNMGMSNRNLQ